MPSGLLHWLSLSITVLVLLVSARVRAAASAATSMAAQTAAMSSLARFTGQIKSKDEVSMTYQLVPAGQQDPKLNDTLEVKASSDGQDVLTPLIQEMANSVLTEAAKK